MRQHIPNMLTVLRLVLAVVFFVLLSRYQYGSPAINDGLILWTAIGLFVIAAATDALDGYLARRWEVVSLFGRVMDPVCDKVLVVGAFVFLAGPQFVAPGSTENVTGVVPWMVVVILVREMLVTSLRAALESSGIEFAAKGAGKLKMILQSVAVPLLLALVWVGPTAEWMPRVRGITVWAVVIATIVSGIPYITGAAKAARGRG